LTGPVTLHFQGPYSGFAGLRLWRGWAFAGFVALGLGGCSLSGPLDMLSSDKETTGSVTPRVAEAKLPPEADLAFTRAAATEVLARGAKDSSQPWENPRSGARGTVTPIATAHVVDGRTCHDFLASYVSGKEESWLQGEACKLDKGAWEVRSLKPWKRS
jgi:surface antigen